MTQQKRAKILNLGIIISIIAVIIGTTIYCIISPRDNLFCIVTATSQDKAQVNILVSEYQGKSQDKEQTFLTTTPVLKASLWTGIINKPAKQEQEKQSGKEILFKKQGKILYYAYHITIKNEDDESISYSIQTQGLDSQEFTLTYGTWDKDGFKANNTLKSGTVEKDKKQECYLIVTPTTPVNELTKNVVQDKKFKINIVAEPAK